MMTYFKGLIKHVSDEGLVLAAGGVGYLFLCPASVYQAAEHSFDVEPSDSFEIWCASQTREDGTTLYGFKTFEERALFLLLLSISGVGGRLALNILSELGLSGLLDAVLQEDAARLQSAEGVGQKMASRLLLELKSKRKRLFALQNNVSDALQAAHAHSVASTLFEALEALKALGYKENEVSVLLKEEMQKAPSSDVTALLQATLQKLGSQRKKAV